MVEKDKWQPEVNTQAHLDGDFGQFQAFVVFLMMLARSNTLRGSPRKSDKDGNEKRSRGATIADFMKGNRYQALGSEENEADEEADNEEDDARTPSPDHASGG